MSIGGKGCDGFTYQTGFTEKRQDDQVMQFTLPGHETSVEIVMDSFTSFYFKRGRLDYLLNPANNEEGFVVINYDEATYVGKFFKDASLRPDSLPL